MVRDLFKNVRKRHDARVVAFGLFGALLGGLSMFVLLNAPQWFMNDFERTLPVLTERAHTVALPSLIRVPAVGIEAPFEEPLGVTERGEIEVPDSYETVSYYKHGPRPGELGPAVVLGHVDSKDGPAVFWSLGELEAGDEIVIEREDGTSAVFRVTRLERHEQSGFPTEKVYGDIDHAGLRLITCTGVYDRGAQRYSHNLIVFAELDK